MFGIDWFFIYISCKWEFLSGLVGFGSIFFFCFLICMYFQIFYNNILLGGWFQGGIKGKVFFNKDGVVC